jgi:hypothetical protein
MNHPAARVSEAPQPPEVEVEGVEEAGGRALGNAIYLDL